MESADIMELFLLPNQNKQLTSIKYINLALYPLYFQCFFVFFCETMQRETFYVCIQITIRLVTFVECEKLKNFVFLVIVSEEFNFNIHSTCSFVYLNLVSQDSF